MTWAMTYPEDHPSFGTADTDAETFLDGQPDGWLSQGTTKIESNDDLSAETLTLTEASLR